MRVNVVPPTPVAIMVVSRRSSRVIGQNSRKPLLAAQHLLTRHESTLTQEFPLTCSPALAKCQCHHIEVTRLLALHLLHHPGELDGSVTHRLYPVPKGRATSCASIFRSQMLTGLQAYTILHRSSPDGESLEKSHAPQRWKPRRREIAGDPCQPGCCRLRVPRIRLLDVGVKSKLGSGAPRTF